MDKQDYATLEISLSASASAGQYSAVLKYRSADTDGTGDRDGHNEEPIKFDLYTLRSMSIDDEGYGEKLSESLFVRGVKEVFSQACAVVFNDNKTLRLRLELRPDAWELHDLRWETLRHPEDSSRPLLTDNRIYFSRYLGSQEWRKVESKRFPETLRILVVIANPSNGSEYKLARLSGEELQRIRESLTTNNHRPTSIVCDQQEGKPATLLSIKEHLRKDYDVFYLLAHGKITETATLVYLEHNDGTCAPTRVEDFVNALKDLPHLPRLVVLASCESAGSGEVPQIPDPMLTAFGPRLVQAGVPAVVAMQGRIKIKTAQTFLQTFFGQIREHGVLDKAMAIARYKVRDEEYHWWRPVLFMRLRSGSIYYKPQWIGKFDWESFKIQIPKKCTAILGPGVYRWITGRPCDIAQDWANEKDYPFPMASYEKRDFPRVAHYMWLRNRDFPYKKLRKHIRDKLWKEYLSDQTQGKKRGYPDWNEVKEVIQEVQKERHITFNRKEPHEILCEFELPLYLETNPYHLLEECLKHKNKKPEIAICPWKKGTGECTQIDIDGTPEKPLVYYLFGIFEKPETLVLTEDDYFDYLIGVTESKEIIPPYIRYRLHDTTLLFLGFQLEDWSFRLILRSIVKQHYEGGLRDNYPHFAVQLEPDDEMLEHPEQALNHLENYFRQTLGVSGNIGIYWGRTEDFIHDLAGKMDISLFWDGNEENG
jgi:hypothetical protein